MSTPPTIQQSIDQLFASTQQAVDTAIQGLESSNQLLKNSNDSLSAALSKLLNVSVFDGLELTPWLLAGGTAANSGQTGSTADAKRAQPTIACAFLEIIPAGPWADKYWYKVLG